MSNMKKAGSALETPSTKLFCNSSYEKPKYIPIRIATMMLHIIGRYIPAPHFITDIRAKNTTVIIGSKAKGKDNSFFLINISS